MRYQYLSNNCDEDIERCLLINSETPKERTRAVMLRELPNEKELD
jgi:hypothetical protein